MNGKQKTYDERFIHFSTFMEKWIIRGIILFFIFLFISQLLLQFSAFRNQWVRTDRLEQVIPIDSLKNL
ncbi:hypothetical protein L1765_05900 [Microaerobacter geothermalis]|nr:hypothetical protein [Microaerobacter geothermalis]